MTENPQCETFKIKPLPWTQHPTHEIWRADTLIGTYKVFMIGEKTTWDFDGSNDAKLNQFSNPAENVEHAKDMCHTHLSEILHEHFLIPNFEVKV